VLSVVRDGGWRLDRDPFEGMSLGGIQLGVTVVLPKTCGDKLMSPIIRLVLIYVNTFLRFPHNICINHYLLYLN